MSSLPSICPAQAEENHSTKKISKKKYCNIPDSVRRSFIKRVDSHEVTIKEAAKEFGLKFSTSKAIFQIYRREGRIGKKKNRNRQSKLMDKNIQEEENSKEKEVFEQKETITPRQTEIPLPDEGNIAHPNCANCPYYLMERMQRDCYFNMMQLFNYMEMMTNLRIMRMGLNFPVAPSCQPY